MGACQPRMSDKASRRRANKTGQPVRLFGPLTGPSLHAAIDFGASGGRVALGRLEHDPTGTLKLEVEVLHRFPNGPVPIRGGLYWDIVGLWRESLEGLKRAGLRAQERGETISSIGVDSWAVDYALLNEHGHLLDGVRCYRDSRTNGVMDAVLNRFPKDTLFEFTGLQFLGFNTLYQLLAAKHEAPELLGRAYAMVMVPDLLHYWLTGRVTCERTNASTTQFYDPRAKVWSEAVLHAMDLPKQILPTIIEAGSSIGKINAEVTRQIGLDHSSFEKTLVIAPGTHDTASAVAAAPLTDSSSAYISSGTWSLVGLETQEPVINPSALESNLTNEAGVNGTNRLLKNVMGLWILQECRRAWIERDRANGKEHDLDWTTLYFEAEHAPAFSSLIDPDDARFLAPGLDMPDRVRVYCLATGQIAPQSRGEIVRCVLESLALKYRLVLEQLEQASGINVSSVHVVGGGSQVNLLNQFTANASGLEVIAGPVDATLIGNLLVQAVGLGVIGWDEIRPVVRQSFPLNSFQPRDTKPWAATLERFRSLLERRTVSNHAVSSHAASDQAVIA
jgi:rhamnulokinase